MDLLLLSRDPSLIHLLYSQEKSLWKIRTDLQSATCPLIAAPSRGHSEPVSLFSCCPTVFFFSLTGWIPYSGSFWQANTDTLQPGKFSGKCVTCYNRPRGEGIKSGKGSAVRQFGIEIYYMSVSKESCMCCSNLMIYIIIHHLHCCTTPPTPQTPPPPSLPGILQVA